MISRGRCSIDEDSIREMIPDTAVAAEYLGITQFPVTVRSLIRQDNRPSMGIWLCPDNRTVMFRDYGTGETGTIYTLLSRIWNLPRDKVILRILDSSLAVTGVSRKVRKSYVRTSRNLEVRIRQWKQHDLDYWETYGISYPWLVFGDVHPVSHIFLSDRKSSICIPAEKYAYVYVERKDNRLSLKLYQPFSENYKWMSKHNSSVWDLWTRLPERGERLIITSSRKDALCLWENTGIPSLSLQGEGYMPKEHVMNQLKDRFSSIYVLYDNDFNKEVNHGRIYGRNLCDRFSLIQLEIPECLHSKDPSDLVRNHGRKELRKLIQSLLQTTQINQQT